MIARQLIRWLGLGVWLTTARAGELPRYTLPQCVDLALRQNADVLVAKKRMEEAAGGIVEARAGYLPSLTSSASFQELADDYATRSSADPHRRNDLWSINVRLTENIYSGGAVSSKMRIARLNQDSQTLDYQSTVDRSLLDVRIAFYDVLQSRAQVTVRQQAVAFLEGELKNQRNRLELGTGDRLHALRAEVSLALEQAGLVEAENRLRNSTIRLSELLGVPCSSAGQVPFEIDGELAYNKTTLDLDTGLQHAQELRPEMKRRANDVAVQRKQLVVDRSALLPRVDLFIGYDVVNEPGILAERSYYNGYLAGVSVTWQWFDGLATKGRLRATRARIDAAELAGDSTRRAIQAEVIRAYHDLQKAEETIQTQQRNVTVAGESLELTQTNVGLGASTQLELLQARLDLTRAQTTELTARFEYNAALARLQRAISSKFTILTDQP